MAKAPDTQPFSIRAYAPTTRSHEVEARLREFLVDNDLKPGQRLPGESWFATRLGVGRPLIREAMRGLEAVGAIEVRRGVGRFVGAFDPGRYLSHYSAQMLVDQFTERELIETRCLLEIAMAPEAVDGLTDDDLEEIDRLWESIQQTAAAGEPNSDADLALHRVIMSRTENRLVMAMLDAMHALAASRTREGGVSTARLKEDLEEHAAIVRAARSRDATAMRAALVAHFETTASRLGFEQRWRRIFLYPVGDRPDAAT